MATLRYPWIFLDDNELDAKFRAATSAATDAPTRYGRIPAEQWSYPSWVPEKAAAVARQRQVGAAVLKFRCLDTAIFPPTVCKIPVLEGYAAHVTTSMPTVLHLLTVF